MSKSFTIFQIKITDFRRHVSFSRDTLHFICQNNDLYFFSVTSLIVRFIICPCDYFENARSFCTLKSSSFFHKLKNLTRRLFCTKVTKYLQMNTILFGANLLNLNLWSSYNSINCNNLSNCLPLFSMRTLFLQFLWQLMNLIIISVYSFHF